MEKYWRNRNKKVNGFRLELNVNVAFILYCYRVSTWKSTNIALHRLLAWNIQQYHVIRSMNLQYPMVTVALKNWLASRFIFLDYAKTSRA